MKNKTGPGKSPLEPHYKWICTLRQQGRTLKDISEILNREKGIRRTSSSLCEWLSRRSKGYRPERQRNHAINDLNHNTQVVLRNETLTNIETLSNMDSFPTEKVANPPVVLSEEVEKRRGENQGKRKENRIVIVTQPQCGGTGKTTVAEAIVDVYHANHIYPAIVDAKSEMFQSYQGLKRCFSEAKYISTDYWSCQHEEAMRAFDQAVELALQQGTVVIDSNSPSKPLSGWLNQVSSTLEETNTKCTLVIPIMAYRGSEYAFDLHSEIPSEFDFITVRNEAAGTKFDIDEKNEQVEAIRKKRAYREIRLQKRLLEIESLLFQQKLTPLQAIEAYKNRELEKLGDSLSKLTTMKAVERAHRQISTELQGIGELLSIPEFI